MTRGFKMARALLVYLLVWFVAPSAMAQQSDITIGYASASDSGAEAAREACKTAQQEASTLGCTVLSAQGDLAKAISNVENLLAQGVSGIVAEVFEPSAFTEVFKRAKKAGVPVAVWSTNSFKGSTNLDELVLTQIGFDRSEFASQIVNAATSAFQEKKLFCLIPFEGGDKNLTEIVIKKLDEVGFTSSKTCSQSVNNAQDLLDQVSKSLRDENISIMILPYFVVNDEFQQLNQIALAHGRTTTFITGWVDQVEITLWATNVLLRAIPGESVESSYSRPAIIQISTDKYCEGCDCTKDTRCKRECSKCQAK